MVRQCILSLAPANDAETSTYTGLMRLALGSAGEYSALFSIGVANWGSLVAFIKFMGDNLERFLPIAGLRSPEWIGCLAGLFCLTSTLEGHNEHLNPNLHPRTHRDKLLEDVSVLSKISSLGLVAGLTFAVTILITAGESEESFAAYVGHAEAANWSGFPVAMGLAIFCNEGAVGPASPHPRLGPELSPQA